MSKLILPAFAALALFCGSAHVQAQPNRAPYGHNHGQHNHHHHGSYHHGSHYHHNHYHHPHYGGYYRPSYSPIVPYAPSNYLGIQLGNFGLSIGSSPYVAPYQGGGYYRGY